MDWGLAHIIKESREPQTAELIIPISSLGKDDGGGKSFRNELGEAWLMTSVHGLGQKGF